MIVGKVVGSVVATRKVSNLIGNKFMIVEPQHHMGNERGRFVAVDSVGAGIGELAMVVQGSAARTGLNQEDTPIDAAIVGIIDDYIGLD